jgi:hypothetical protein
MMGKKLETFKAVVGFGVSLGAGIIVGNIVNLTTPPNTKALSKVLVKAGTFALAGYAGEKAAQYTNETIDDVAAVFGVAKTLGDNVSFVVNNYTGPQPMPADPKPADNK